MREIKYRQLIDGKWHYWGYGIDADDMDGRVFTSPLKTAVSAPSYQYTGLKDKNGKEIYEGDILKTKHRRIVFGESSDGSFLNPSSEEYEKVGVIEHYLGHQFGYRLRWKKGHLMIDTTMMISNMKGEVIGNIYEQQELLEGGAAIAESN